MFAKAFNIAVLRFFLCSAVLLTVQPAMAEKGGKGAGAKHADKSGGHSESHHEEEDSLFGFSDNEADIIIGVLRGLYGDPDRIEFVRPSRQFCPPGLAKKNNGCMPPGQAKKYAIGERLPDDVIFSDLPEALLRQLGAPPKGRKYVQVDKDILLIEAGTRLVLDAIGVSIGR